jgi:glutaredoxin
LAGKEISVDVIGPNPPCKRCDATWKNVEKATTVLKSEGVELEVMMNKLNIADKNVISRFGVLMSPAVALNGIVRVMGRVPDAKEVASLIREAVA